MTTKQTLKALAASGKKISLGRLYIYLKRFEIKPSGVNQRPQQYPPDSAERILQHLGFSTGAVASGQADWQPSKTSGNGRAGGIISLKTPRAERNKRKAAR